jgi:hypothetical protein
MTGVVKDKDAFLERVSPLLEQYLVLTTLQARQREARPPKKLTPDLLSLAAKRAQTKLTELHLDSWTDSSIRGYLIYEVPKLPLPTTQRVTGGFWEAGAWWSWARRSGKKQRRWNDEPTKWHTAQRTMHLKRYFTLFASLNSAFLSLAPSLSRPSSEVMLKTSISLLLLRRLLVAINWFESTFVRGRVCRREVRREAEEAGEAVI